MHFKYFNPIDRLNRTSQQILYRGRDLRRKAAQIHMLRRARRKPRRTAAGAEGVLLVFAPFAVRRERQGVLDDVPGRGDEAMR